MTHKMTRLIACLCLVGLLLAGCNRQEADGPGAMGSQVWEGMPALTVGTLSYDKLEILPWDNGRCEATSRNAWAETENGYYMIDFVSLYYADKSDLVTWVPVCNQPDCEHSQSSWNYGDVYCNAVLGSSSFVIKDDRIICVMNSRDHPHFTTYEAPGYFLMSMAPDGTDRQTAYTLDEAVFSGGGLYTCFLTSQGWLYYTDYLDKDGNSARRLFHTTDAGTQEITINCDKQVDGWMTVFANGDKAYYGNALGTSEYGCYRLVDGELVETDCTGLEADTEGAYLSGNTLRVFRSNDGYYDIDLTTREEIFLAPAQLENSLASIMLPNCIIESTMFDSSGWSAKTSHQMKLFDGESWRPVELPEDLAYSGAFCKFFRVNAVTSDSVFFRCTIGGKDYYYRIPLNAENLAAELCGEIC